MPKKRAEVEIKTTADLKAAKEAQGTFKQMAQEVPILGRALNLLRQPLTLVIGLFATLATTALKSVNAFGALQNAMAPLQAALAQQGNLTARNVSLYNDLAAELGKLTGSTVSAAEVLRTLTVFGSTPDTIQRDLDAAKNLAGILGGSLTDAARAVGKALKGNFDTFREYGLQVERTGDLTRDLDALFTQLAERGAGQLEARAATLAGTWKQVTNAGGDLLAAIGGLINQTGVLQNVFQGAITFFESWTEILGGSIPLMDGFKNRIDNSAEAQRRAADAAREHAEELKFLDERLPAINQELERQNRALDQQQSDELALSRAQESLELTKLRASGATGADLAAGEFEIKKRFAEERLGIRQRVADEKDEANKQAVEELTATITGLKSELEQLNTAIARDERQNRINQRLADDTDELFALREKAGTFRQVPVAGAPGVYRRVGGLTEEEANRLRLLEMQATRTSAVPTPLLDVNRERRSNLRTQIGSYETSLNSLQSTFGEESAQRAGQLRQESLLTTIGLQETAVSALGSVQNELGSARSAASANVINQARQRGRQIDQSAAQALVQLMGTLNSTLDVMESLKNQVRELDIRTQNLRNQ